MPNKIANRVKMTVSGTPGTGTITLGSAVAGFQSFAGAGVSNSDTVPYVIEDGSSWELGVGNYTATGTSLSRSVTASSNSGNPINATSAAIVMISPLAADLQSGTAANNLVRLDGSSKLPAVDGSALTGVVASSMAASGLTGTLGVASGGTGLSSLASGRIPYGNGTGAFSNSANLVFDGSNLGLGVTPSAWSNGYKSLQVGGAGFGLSAANSAQGIITQNAVYNGGWKYVTADYANYIEITGGNYRWFTAPSGTAGSAISFTQAMTLTSGGDLGVGSATVNTAGVNRAVTISGTSNSILELNAGATRCGYLYSSSAATSLSAVPASSILLFLTADTERARIDSSGNLLVNVQSATEGSRLRVSNNDSTEWSSATVVFNSANGTKHFAIYNGAVGYSTTSCVMQVGKNSSSSRSINAAGTVNASGADYAEYMTKAGEFTVSKGDICGIDADGKITNVFADAVAFVVKSTNPSYVGGDTWGVGFEKDDPAIEIARQKVDRIAFAGQVPVNVIGASAGDYIIPENDNGSIKGVAVSNPTLEQYRISVGRVIATEADGRARIIVKVA